MHCSDYAAILAAACPVVVFWRARLLAHRAVRLPGRAPFRFHARRHRARAAAARNKRRTFDTSIHGRGGG
jgi:hypothetical protein